MRWIAAIGLLPAVLVASFGCETESSSGADPALDGGPQLGVDASGQTSLDGSAPDTSAPGPDGSTATRTGRMLRFAHLAHEQQAEQLDFCLETAPDSDTYTPVYAPMGAPGLHYGEVGRYIPITPGEHRYRTTSTGDCQDDFSDSGDLFIPELAYGRYTFALTLTDTGVISVQTGDTEDLRDAAKDRITLLDGTGPRGNSEVLPVSWVGPSTVDLSVQNFTRSKSMQLEPGLSGNLVVSGDTAGQRLVRTVAGGHALVVLYGAGLMRVCDYDTPDPTTGVLSTCNERN